MDKKYFVIPLVVIAILAVSDVASASVQNEVGVDLEAYRHFNVKSDSFEAGEYTIQKEYWFRVWNWNDPSEENINEVRIIFYPKESGQIKNVEVEGDELESKEPYTGVSRDIPMDSGLGMHIWTDTKETVFFPVSVYRDVDISYFETTGTQLVRVTVTPKSNIDTFGVEIKLREDWQSDQEVADVKLLSTSKDYFHQFYEERWIRFEVKGAEEGKDYVFKVELQITPREGKATYVPAVYVRISTQVEGEVFAGTSLEKSSKIGTFKVLSAEELNFHPHEKDTLGIYMPRISTTARFMEEAEKPVTGTPMLAPEQAQPVFPGAKPEEPDSDGDGWTDKQERRAGTNPFAKDTDGDGIWDSKDPNPLESNGEKKGADWEQIGVILAIIGGIIGWLFSRRKRGRVKKMLDEIDETYESFKMNPRRCEAELYRHRDIVLEQLKKGKISEESYSILEKRIDNYLGEVRERIMRERFGDVPARLKDEVHHMLEDGEIREDEYKAFENILSKSEGIGIKEKSDLKGMLKKWRDEDKITGSALEEYIDEYMKDVGEVGKKVSGIELKVEIDKIMEDGIVTQEEYEEFSKMLDSSDLREDEKENLKRKLRKIRDLSNK